MKKAGDSKQYPIDTNIDDELEKKYQSYSNRSSTVDRQQDQTPKPVAAVTEQEKAIAVNRYEKESTQNIANNVGASNSKNFDGPSTTGALEVTVNALKSQAQADLEELNLQKTNEERQARELERQEQEARQRQKVLEEKLELELREKLQKEEDEAKKKKAEADAFAREREMEKERLRQEERTRQEAERAEIQRIEDEKRKAKEDAMKGINALENDPLFSKYLALVKDKRAPEASKIQHEEEKTVQFGFDAGETADEMRCY